jgi:hypothetical protein
MLPTLPGQVNSELGLAFHTDSAFLRGILSKTSVATRANINGTVICARSENDTQNNPHNPMYGIAKAGASGDLVTLVGTDASESGGRSVAPMSMIDPSIRPTKVDRPRDVTGLVDTGRLVELLSANDAGAVMRAVERISDLKSPRLNMIIESLIRAVTQSTWLVEQFGNPPLTARRGTTGQATSISARTITALQDRRMKLIANTAAQHHRRRLRLSRHRAPPGNHHQAAMGAALETRRGAVAS